MNQPKNKVNKTLQKKHNQSQQNQVNQKPNQNRIIRLNKLLSQHGFCSRRKADEWIEQGRVSIDGVICRELGTQVNLETQKVVVDGKTLNKKAPKKIYLALNKPRNVVSTKRDPQGRTTVLDILPKDIQSQGLFPVGRLDADSEGLLLLSNDGDWSHILLHPSHQVWKQYQVKCNKPIAPIQIDRLQKGVYIDQKKTLPAKISLPPNKPTSNTFRISIREGRNRQIRKMCKEVGLEVIQLTRLSIGSISIINLKPGEFRHLTKKEVDYFFLIDQPQHE